MTNRQSKSNPEALGLGAGRALWVLAKLVGGLAALGVTVWFIVTTDGPWDAVGAITWAWVGKSLTDSGVADVLRLGRAQQEAASKYADNTGVWKAQEAGSFTVRWDEDERVYYVSGWISEHFSLPHETLWPDTDTLANVIEAAEIEGMIPEDDGATRSIRARLDIPGWDGTDPAEARRIRDELAGRGES